MVTIGVYVGVAAGIITIIMSVWSLLSWVAKRHKDRPVDFITTQGPVMRVAESTDLGDRWAEMTVMAESTDIGAGRTRMVTNYWAEPTDLGAGRIRMILEGGDRFTDRIVLTFWDKDRSQIEEAVRQSLEDFGASPEQMYLALLQDELIRRNVRWGGLEQGNPGSILHGGVELDVCSSPRGTQTGKPRPPQGTRTGGPRPPRGFVLLLRGLPQDFGREFGSEMIDFEEDGLKERAKSKRKRVLFAVTEVLDLAVLVGKKRILGFRLRRRVRMD